MNEKQKVYLSGKMRGLDEEVSRKLFADAQKELEAKGFEVVNPWDAEPEKDENCENWGDYLIFDLKILQKCDKIFMLQNYKDSWGAQTELAFAQGMGLGVMYQEKPFQKLFELKPVFVAELPQRTGDMRHGILYIKEHEDGMAESFHLCPCGCGEPVYLVYDKNGWKMGIKRINEGTTEESTLVTLTPSIGCFDLPCKSHYFIRENKIVWV